LKINIRASRHLRISPCLEKSQYTLPLVWPSLAQAPQQADYFTVHFPIAFLSLAWGLDILYAATTKLQLAPLVKSVGTSLPDISRGAHYLQAIGLVTAIPAVLSGAQQLIKMKNNNQAFEADGKTMRPKFATTLTHAALNDVALVVAAYSWYTRRESVGLLPSDANLLISVVLLPVLFYSASLGGKLVYNYGVGINLAKPKGKGT
jgi:uncharacterized membrane protein